jgi:hypothetical protein
MKLEKIIEPGIIYAVVTGMIIGVGSALYSLRSNNSLIRNKKAIEVPSIYVPQEYLEELDKKGMGFA